MTKAVLKNFAIFTGEYLCWSLFLIKSFKATWLQVFSCEYCGIFKITCFEEHLQMAASVRCYFDAINLKQSGFCTTYSFKILVSERKCKINLKSRESQKKKKKKKLQSSYTCLCKARSKTRKPEKSRKSWKFFSQNFKSEFPILAVGQTRKLGNKETWNNFSGISDFSEFSICHFFIFQKKKFSIF